MTPNVSRLVVFTVEGSRYAVPLSSVERVLPMAAVRPVPGAPRVVLGAINLAGRVVPVSVGPVACGASHPANQQADPTNSIAAIAARFMLDSSGRVAGTRRVPVLECRSDRRRRTPRLSATLSNPGAGVAREGACRPGGARVPAAGIMSR